MRYRGMIAITLALSLNFLLLGRTLAHGLLISSNSQDCSQWSHPSGASRLIFSESFDGAQKSFTITDDQDHTHDLGHVDSTDLGRKIINQPMDGQTDAGASNVMSSVITTRDNARTVGTARLRVSGAETQQSEMSQPTATPAGQASTPARRHGPEPLPQEIHWPIARGLLITPIVVIGIILLHRVRLSRR